jgi:hypothetical protein
MTTDFHGSKSKLPKLLMMAFSERKKISVNPRKSVAKVSA